MTTSKNVSLLGKKQTHAEKMKPKKHILPKITNERCQEGETSKENKLSALETFTGKKASLKNPKGLCFACGNNFKENSHDQRPIECDLCDQIYHLKCGPVQSGCDLFDKVDPIFVCKACMDFQDNIARDLKLEDF